MDYNKEIERNGIKIDKTSVTVRRKAVQNHSTRAQGSWRLLPQATAHRNGRISSDPTKAITPCAGDGDDCGVGRAERGMEIANWSGRVGGE
ncbi:hypothetical protein RJZ56_001359 [Blastomyces dermatitidis]